ncbi:MAG TPA: DEAD/DEAH box helicase [Gammaproteobacteria bacterium]|nr:DEAD/DEAH box helicase [Gammaproteobacteria bacterium]
MIDGNRVWKVLGDQLVLENNAGVYYPSANEVYECVIEGKPVFRDVQPGEPAYLDGLLFSRYPARLFIAVGYEPHEGESGLFCRVIASCEGEEVCLDGFRSRRTDHVVLGRKWYPFMPGAAGEVMRILDDVGLGDTEELTFRQFMQLKKVAQENDIVQDLTTGEIVHPGISVDLGENALCNFKGTLYPYQKDGWRWLSFICKQELGGILADEMGLGKTVQIIAALSGPERHKLAPSLIVAPSTLLENWRREILKFAPSMKTLVHQGPNRTGMPGTLRDNDIVIASYETVARDGALFDMIDWRVVVLDEAQAIKNPETRRSAAVKRLKRSVAIAVTGTPVENKLRDLWSIVDFVLPGYLGDEADFERRFGNGLDGGSAVEPFVSPIMLRRRVADVARDLPERIDIPQVLTLDGKEASAYERLREEILEQYGKSASLVALTKLRMFCTHPWLTENGRAEGDNPLEFCKFRRLIEIVEEIFGNREKVLVFTSYNLMSDMIIKEVNKRFDVYAEAIDGRTPVDQRQITVDRFSKYNGPALLALNPRAAGAGLNITAANHVIHYTLEWNPAVEDQASARAYRRGQDKPVTVHRMFIADTVEEAIDQRLERKRQLSDAAVVGLDGREDDYEDIIRALQLSPVREGD